MLANEMDVAVAALPPELLGVLLAALAGILVGAAPWPVKVMRNLKYEHWGFIAMLTGLVVVPKYLSGLQRNLVRDDAGRPLPSQRQRFCSMPSTSHCRAVIVPGAPVFSVLPP